MSADLAELLSSLSDLVRLLKQEYPSDFEQAQKELVPNDDYVAAIFLARKLAVRLAHDLKAIEGLRRLLADKVADGATTAAVAGAATIALENAQKQAGTALQLRRELVDYYEGRMIANYAMGKLDGRDEALMLLKREGFSDVQWSEDGTVYVTSADGKLTIRLDRIKDSRPHQPTTVLERQDQE